MEPSYIGEIKLFAGNFAPLGWAFCDGSVIGINANEALFKLIGTTYGGDGLATFALPDLRGRVPLNFGQGNGLSLRKLGESGGAETVVVTSEQLPAHKHIPQANSGAGNSDSVAAHYWSGSAKTAQFAADSTTDTTMNSKAIGANGDNQPHENMLPFLALNFIICMEGVFPSRN